MSVSHIPAELSNDVSLRVLVDVRCLVDGDLRGFSRYTSELLRGLMTLRSVELVGVSDRPLDRDLGFDVAVVDGGREWRVEQLGFSRVASRVGADVLFCPTNRGLPATGAPSVLTLHDAVEWDADLVPRPTGRSRLRFGYSTAASLAGATRILTVSRHSAREIRSRLGIAADRIDVVLEAAGHSFRRTHTTAELREARLRYGLPEEFALYVGGFDAKKSVETLFRAWRLIPADRRLPLVLGGRRGRDADALAAAVARLGVDDDVRFIGYVDDPLLPALYSTADLFVFPAVAEGFGLPPLEAMACGTATIVADAGALPEVVGSAAVRFAAGDASSLARVVARLTDDRAERDRLSAQGRAHALARSWVDVAHDTVAVLRRAAGTSRVRRAAGGVGSLTRVHRWLR